MAVIELTVYWTVNILTAMGRLPRNDKMNKPLGRCLSTASLRVIKRPFGDVSERVCEKLMAGGLTPRPGYWEGCGCGHILGTQQEHVWGSGLLYFPAPELIMTHPYHQEEVEAGLLCEMQ